MALYRFDGDIKLSVCSDSGSRSGEKEIMKYVFYITNHGFGHASRNVPLIKYILDMDLGNSVYVKSDVTRCEFVKKNLLGYENRIEYISDCHENGVILKEGQLTLDIEATECAVKKDLQKWDEYIERECLFLRNINPDVVVSDIIPWALKAAHICGIKAFLIGSFTWVEMYQDYFEKEIWEPYLECYHLAYKALWYDIHPEVLYSFCETYENVSLVSRSCDKLEAKRIAKAHKNPIVFVSIGGSANLDSTIDVEGLPFDFIVTKGLSFRGSNVYQLPPDTINTPDYIAASDVVIAKGGWSTVAEILLARKKCGLLFRGNNSEDKTTKAVLLERKHCIDVNTDDLMDMENLIKKIQGIEPSTYEVYRNDTEKICKIISS